MISSELLSMNFLQENEVSKLELQLDNSEVKAHMFNVKEDRQIIIDLKNVTAKKKVIRAFDTSEFTGSVVFIDAYPKPGEPSTLRVAVLLRENVRSLLNKEKDKIVIDIENRYGVFTQREIDSGHRVSESESQDSEDGAMVNIPKSDSVEDILENLTLSGRKKYIGKRLSFSFRDVPVEDVMHMIANASGFNIIINDEVKKLPNMSLSLTNIAWDQALDTILGLNKLVATKNGNILMVTTLEQATKEKKLEIEAQKTAEIQEPLVTKIFPLSFANLKEMESILNPYKSERGSISMDERTNSFIVKDKVDVIERMKKIIESLDTQTPQVLIEAKIVEINEEHAKTIGLRNGFNFSYDPIGLPGKAIGDVGSVGGSGDSGPGFTFSSAAKNGNGVDGSIFSLGVGQFGRVFNLGFDLQLLETEKKAKIVSNPKVVTENKREATIREIQEIYVKVLQSGTIEGAGNQYSYETKQAELTLNVTPQITNEGSIAMKIAVKKEVFGGKVEGELPTKNTREVATNVLVDNGSTIVIGGIYSYQRQEGMSGIPFLKDIPLLGWLFRTSYNPSTQKYEMIIFLTPRIINQEEAGLVDRG